MKHVISLLGSKENNESLAHIKNFEFDAEEVTYSTGWVVMDSPSDGEQRGSATLTLQDGERGKLQATLTGSFVNKRKFDGDHFVAVAGFLDSKGALVEKIRVQRGLDGMWKNFRFKTQRGGATASKELEKSDGIETIVLVLGYRDTTDDTAFWDTVKEIATKVLEAYASQQKQENQSDMKT